MQSGERVEQSEFLNIETILKYENRSIAGSPKHRICERESHGDGDFGVCFQMALTLAACDRQFRQSVESIMVDLTNYLTAISMGSLWRLCWVTAPHNSAVVKRGLWNEFTVMLNQPIMGSQASCLTFSLPHSPRLKNGMMLRALSSSRSSDQ